MARTLELAETAQQKDNLCGPFWAARILRAAGIEEWDGEPIDEDLVALRAGTLLPDPDDGSVPPGAASRTGYRFELPRVPPAQSGTPAAGLAAALDEAAAGALRSLPLRGAWTAERVVSLLDGAHGIPGARLLANVRTGRFWGSRPPVEALLAELAGEEAEGPPADWDVGHFCELELLVRGPGAESVVGKADDARPEDRGRLRRPQGGSLVVVHDSYPSFGWEGRHLQPPRAVAAALERGDGREGGVLAVVPAAHAAEAEALGRSLGLELDIWDNGTRR